MHYMRWQGQCDQCGEWNSLEEVLSTSKVGLNDADLSAAQLSSLEEPATQRVSTGFSELNRVTGGGWVIGSVNLICGEPGIGKSTIVLQSLMNGSSEVKKTMIVTAEESSIQVKHRSNRICSSIPNNLFIASLTEMESIIEIIVKESPDVVVLDSIQMVMSHKLTSMPGSLNQVRLCASMFIKVVKRINAVGILVGHITKDGQLAGPKMLEHMVDSILFFEGERTMSIRMLRSLKNRFGTTNETGLFKMQQNGLVELKESAHIVSMDPNMVRPGSIITAILSGTRGVLVELQALVVTSNVQQIKRTFVGVDSHRSHLMIAILDKYFNLKLSMNDVFLSLVGGFKSQSPDIDLAVCFSVLSSAHFKQVPKNIAVLGEVGLTGDVMPITHLDNYMSSMELLGIKTCIIPTLNRPDWQDHYSVTPIFVSNILEAHQIFNRVSLSDS